MTTQEMIECLNSHDYNDLYIEQMADDDEKEFSTAIKKAIRSLEENKALRLLVEWAVECGFGYDNFPEEYEKYKDEIKDMGYIDGMIYIAMNEAEK